MIKAIFFDLDGTLLPLNEEEFIKYYFGLLCQKLAPLGFESAELVNVIWEGTKGMYANDGSKSNEEVFWTAFKNHYGNYEVVKPLVDEFYVNEFKLTKSVCKDNPYALDIVKFCKQQNIRIFLTTNPIFPREGTLTRMGFVNLNETDFEYITTYENSSYSKPNPQYFIHLLNTFDLKPEEVILFGNNTYEDGECSHSCGIKCYMVGDFVIHHPKTKHEFEHIKIEEIIPTIQKYLLK